LQKGEEIGLAMEVVNEDTAIEGKRIKTTLLFGGGAWCDAKGGLLLSELRSGNLK